MQRIVPRTSRRMAPKLFSGLAQYHPRPSLAIASGSVCMTAKPHQTEPSDGDDRLIVSSSRNWPSKRLQPDSASRNEGSEAPSHERQAWAAFGHSHICTLAFLKTIPPCPINMMLTPIHISLRSFQTCSLAVNLNFATSSQSSNEYISSSSQRHQYRRKASGAG